MRKTLLTVFATILLAGVAVAGDYTAPVVEGKRVMPDYPPAALAAGFEGVVKVAGVINADGSVGAVEVIDDPAPHLGFGDAAIQAIRRWQFHAGRVDSRAVDSVGAFVFRFQSRGRLNPRAQVDGEFLNSRARVATDGILDKSLSVTHVNGGTGGIKERRKFGSTRQRCKPPGPIPLPESRGSIGPG